VFLAAMAVTPSFWAAVVLAALAGIADGPSLAATLSIRQQTVPPDRYAQATATAASLKTGAYALGAGCVGLFTSMATPRQLMLGIAAGQLLAVVPLLASRGPVSAIPNEALVPDSGLPVPLQVPDAGGFVGARGRQAAAVQAER
jgi:hypothetical protein